MVKADSQIYAEVLILLNYYLIPEELNKIPKEKLDFMTNEADKEFELYIDETKTFAEQKISRKAKAMILSLYKKYFINKEQGEKLDQLLKSINIRAKGTKTENSSNYDDKIKQIYENKKDEIIEKETVKETVKEEITVYKESLFTKLVNKIKKWFSK